MGKLVEKYRISERDLYILSLIEFKKKSVGLLEKEDLKASSLTFLKPYNVSLIDIGNLLEEIARNDYHRLLESKFTEEEKLDIEGKIMLNSDAKSFYLNFLNYPINWWKEKTQKDKIIYLSIVVMIILGSIIKR